MLYSCSVPKRVESASTMVSVIWWVIGFYWVTAAGRQDLEENSPQLYWFVRTNFALVCPLYIYFIFLGMFIGLAVGFFRRLCVTFLAFDALFVIICAAAACLIGIAVCCCLPCIIGILYAMTDPVKFSVGTLAKQLLILKGSINYNRNTAHYLFLDIIILQSRT